MIIHFGALVGNAHLCIINRAGAFIIVTNYFVKILQKILLCFEKTTLLIKVGPRMKYKKGDLNALMFVILNVCNNYMKVIMS